MKDSAICIEQNSLVSIKSDVIYNLVDNEVIILSLNNEEYYSLNAVGSVIWGEITKPVPISAIVNELVKKFDVSQERCKIETLEYIKELFNLKIIDVANP